MVDLRKKIKDAGFTLVEVGNAIGVSKSGMTSLVNAKNPQYSALEKIANFLGISVSELVAEDSGSSVTGFVKYEGTIYEIASADDLLKLADRVRGEITKEE